MAYIGKQPTPVPLTAADFADDTITEAKMANDAISLAELKAGTDGEIISWDASGNPVAVGVGTAGHFLKSAGAGSPPVFAAAGGITAASQWRLTTAFTGDANPIASNLEVVDTDGYGSLGSAMSESSGIFTFPSTGYWYIQAVFQKMLNGDDRVLHGNIDTTTDNSSYSDAANNSGFIQQTSSNDTYATTSCNFIFDVTNTTTHKCRFYAGTANQSTTTGGSTSSNSTYFTFIRLGDT
tara:strand:+ start:41 stop:754 length:714 start_codon:yes stop_codon:yes gene_type:complete